MSNPSNDEKKRPLDQDSNNPSSAQKKRSKTRKGRSNNVGNSSSLDIHGADVWDDSELIAAWDRGVEAYKKWHSQGGNVQDLKYQENDGLNQELEEAEDGQVEEDIEMDAQGETGPAENISELHEAEDGEESGEIDEEIPSKSASLKPLQETKVKSPQKQKNIAKSTNTQQDDQTYPTEWPENPFEDPNLSRLIMSWYWAGYYTGLHQAKHNQ